MAYMLGIVVIESHAHIPAYADVPNHGIHVLIVITDSNRDIFKIRTMKSIKCNL